MPLRRADGSVVVFGRAGRGALAEPVEQVVQLQATRDAFAALRPNETEFTTSFCSFTFILCFLIKIRMKYNNLKYTYYIEI